jgi:hypothetical protein
MCTENGNEICENSFLMTAAYNDTIMETNNTNIVSKKGIYAEKNIPE